jgi:hypothetical protein
MSSQPKALTLGRWAPLLPLPLALVAGYTAFDFENGLKPLGAFLGAWLIPGVILALAVHVSLHRAFARAVARHDIPTARAILDNWRSNPRNLKRPTIRFQLRVAEAQLLAVEERWDELHSYLRTFDAKESAHPHVRELRECCQPYRPGNASQGAAR